MHIRCDTIAGYTALEIPEENPNNQRGWIAAERAESSATYCTHLWLYFWDSDDEENAMESCLNLRTQQPHSPLRSQYILYSIYVGINSLSLCLHLRNQLTRRQPPTRLVSCSLRVVSLSLLSAPLLPSGSLFWISRRNEFRQRFLRADRPAVG